MAVSVLPQRPQGSLLTGHFGAYQRDPLGFLTHCARTYGDVVPLRFGPARVVLLSHPDLIEDVLVRKHQSFGKSRFVIKGVRPVLGTGLFSSDGELWRRQRRMMQPAFHRARIAAYGELMVAATRRMLATWRPGERRDLFQDMSRLTLAIVANALFHADVEGDAAAVGKALTVGLEATNARLTSLWAPLLPDRFPSPANLRLRRVVRELDAIIFRIIALRRASGEDPGDLLSLLLHARDEEDDGGGMTDHQLRDELMTLFLAGHETTAVALAWTWQLLSQHPAVEAKLVAELESVLGGRLPTADDLPRLAYTEMVVQEALRLYPPVWAISRDARVPCELGGQRVAAGTGVIMSQWVVQRDPRYFDRPDDFHPERWEDGLAKRLPRFAYFPFGGGPRRCIGAEFAMMEAILIVATVAHHVRLAAVPGPAVVPQVAVTLRPQHGVPLVVQPRQQDR